MWRAVSFVTGRKMCGIFSRQVGGGIEGGKIRSIRADVLLFG